MKSVKKPLRLLPALLALLLALLCMAPAACALGVDSVRTFYIEQVYANVPALDVFVYALNSDGEPLSPSLVNAAGVELTVGGKKVDAGTILMANEPVCYIFLLDDSASMDPAAFAAYKRAVLQTVDAMGEKDQLLLYTAAGGVQRRVGAGAGRSAVSSLLRHLGQSDESSDLAGAVARIAADVNADFQNLAPRKALFACTGSRALLENAALLAGMASGEGSGLNMALFTFAATENAAMQSALAALAGGRTVLADAAQMPAAVAEKRAYLSNALEIKTAVDSSMGGERMDTLTLSVPSLGSAVSVSTSVYMGHTLARPQVTSVSVRDQTHLAVRFNQAVDHAGAAANYSIRSEDAWSWRVGVHAVELSEDGLSAVLTTDPLYQGGYSVQLRKVASRMSAANVCGSERTGFAVTQWPADSRFYFDRFRLPAAVLLVLLAALAGRGALQKRRDRAAETAAEVEHLLAEPVRADPQLPKRWVTLFVRTRGSIAEKRYSIMLESSLMIGSDPALCDLALEDDRVRPQHCILAAEGEEITVQPLDKRCTVYIGKVRIGDAHRLKNNDVIAVGGARIQLVL